MDRFERRLRSAAPGFRDLLARVPLQSAPPLPAGWLRCEMLERFEVLDRAGVATSPSVLEVGAGPHAISTIPLAHWVGPEGRVVAAERSRWGQFRAITAASGLSGRIRPVTSDARRLPLRSDAAGLAVCLHGIRSLGGTEDTIRVLREMLRIAPRILLAESIPLARTDAQRAHLAMYDLREEVFRRTTGTPDDRRYLPLDALVPLVERAGGVVDRSETFEVSLPHALAFFPRSLIEGIPPGEEREILLRRWDEADRGLRRFGEEHPPVGIIVAHRP